MSYSEFMIDSSRRATMTEFARRMDVVVLSASSPMSEDRKEYAEMVGGEVWKDPLRPGSDRTIVVRRKTPEVRHENNKEAIAALRKQLAGIKDAFIIQTRDAFGTAMNVNGWANLVIPKEHYTAVEIAAGKLGIKLYDPICSDIYGVHRKISIEQQSCDVDRLKEKLGEEFDAYVLDDASARKMKI